MEGNMSQSLKILGHLKRGQSITQIQALRLYGCMRLAARIEELRELYPIHTKLVYSKGKRFARYSLVV